MKMDKVAGSGFDEYYTPEYAIDPILKYIAAYKTKVLQQRYMSAYRGGCDDIPEQEKQIRIWCPFDTQDSNYVKMLSNDYDVVYTHKDKNEDFFDLVQGGFATTMDLIISNPPYSKKTEILQTLFRLGKPFAMLVGVVGLFESQVRFNMFKGNDFEIMYFNKRISFFKDFTEQKPSANPPFSSVYICHGLLPKQIMFEEIDKSRC